MSQVGDVNNDNLYKKGISAVANSYKIVPLYRKV